MVYKVLSLPDTQLINAKPLIIRTAARVIPIGAYALRVPIGKESQATQRGDQKGRYKFKHCREFPNFDELYFDCSSWRLVAPRKTHWRSGRLQAMPDPTRAAASRHVLLSKRPPCSEQSYAGI